MNREILFRGKRVDNGKWVEGCYLKYPTFDSNAELHIIVDGKGQYNAIDISTCGEFTGLTDKNGKRIFEGDILRFRSGIYCVTWCNERSKFLQIDRGFSRELHSFIENGEAIGNIHDNPELMKGEESNA